ncbi:MAG: lipopolysaccharide biosynthesis protein [Planctomycetaceae bacterium]
MTAEFGTLKARIVSGAFFSGGSQILRQLVQLGAIALLARVLGPEPYGLLALAVAVLGLVQLGVEFGLGSSVVREQELTPRQESTLLKLNLGAGLLLCALVEAFAPLAGRLFREPELAWVLRGVAPGYLLVGALSTRRAKLQRAMRFRLTAGIDLLAVALGAATSILLATAGMGTVSLVLGLVAHHLCWSLAVLLAAGLPPRAPFDLASVKPLLRYGGWLTGFGVVNYFARTLDNMLVGGLMGRAALGLYEKSYALMMLPVTQISAVLSQVMHPALSSVRGDKERFTFLYLGALRKVAGLAFPLATVCITGAGPIVRLLLGERFAPAVPIFQALSLVMALQALLSSVGWIYLASGRTRTMFLWGTLNAAVVCAFIVFGALRGSPLDVARAYSIAIALLFFPSVAVALRAGGISLRAFFGRVAAPALSATAACLLVRWIPGLTGLRAPLAAAGLYVTAHLLLDRRALLDLLSFLDPRRAFGG